MLKVLHVSPWYEPSWWSGGVACATTNMCRGLVSQGINVHVFTNVTVNEHKQLKLPLDQEVLIYGVRVHYFLRTEFRRFPPSSKLMNQRLQERIPEFDLVHIHAVRHWYGRVVSSICSRHNIPFIVTPHALMASWMVNGFGHSILKNIYFQLIDRSVFTKSAAVHYTSEYEREASRYLIGNIPSFVTPCGVVIPDADRDNVCRQRWRENLNLSDSHRVLLFVGRIHPVKNLHLMIEALAQLQDKYIKLFCVGFIHDRNYFSELQNLILESKLEKNVIFIPPVENKQLYDWYMCADAFVLSSKGEGASMSLSEALSYGLPVIISDGVSNCDDIDRAGCGRVVSQNVQSFVEVFHDFINSGSVFEGYSSNAKLYAQRHFAQNVATTHMCYAYRDILSGERHEELNWDVDDHCQ